MRRESDSTDASYEENDKGIFRNPIRDPLPDGRPTSPFADTDAKSEFYAAPDDDIGGREDD